jgi:hypothetical protein
VTTKCTDRFDPVWHALDTAAIVACTAPCCTAAWKSCEQRDELVYREAGYNSAELTEDEVQWWTAV